MLSDASPSLYEQETAILNGARPQGEQWSFDDQPSGLRALDGKDEDVEQSVAKREAPEEPLFCITPKRLKSSCLSMGLSAAALPKAYERRAQIRRQKKLAHLRYRLFVGNGLSRLFLAGAFLGQSG